MLRAHTSRPVPRRPGSMEIVTLAPLTAATLLWQTAPGQWAATVCVKVTLRLVADGAAVPADEQEPLVDERLHEGGPDASPFYPGDLVPLKAKTDVMLVGHAYAPRGGETTSMVARFRVGELERSLRVMGERVWSHGPRGLEASAPAPLTRMPLRYELAQRTPNNPVGIDLAVKRVPGARALPSFETEDGGTPGFGPIAPMWRPRSRRISDDGLAWAQTFSPDPGRAAGPAPPGFDFRFFNAAPPEQQLDLLRSGTIIELENLSPERPLFETRLPAVRPRAFRIDPRSGRAHEVALRCDTLWIDTDRAVAIAVWRGLLDLRSREEHAMGTLAVTSELPGKKVRIEAALAAAKADAARPGDAALFDDDDADEDGWGGRDPLGVRHDSVKPRSAPPRDAQGEPGFGPEATLTALDPPSARPHAIRPLHAIHAMDDERSATAVEAPPSDRPLSSRPGSLPQLLESIELRAAREPDPSPEPAEPASADEEGARRAREQP